MRGGGKRIKEMFLVMLGTVVRCIARGKRLRRPVSCMDQGAVGQCKKRLVEDRGAFAAAAAMLHWCINSRKTRMIIRQAL